MRLIDTAEPADPTKTTGTSPTLAEFEFSNARYRQKCGVCQEEVSRWSWIVKPPDRTWCHLWCVFDVSVRTLPAPKVSG